QYLLIEARTGDPSLGHCFEAEGDLARTLESVATFKTAIQTKFTKLKADLAEASARGPVALWGSGSKAVSYLTTLGVGDLVSAVVDINPHKHGKFLAGTGHEIIAPEKLKEIQPAHVLIMNAIYVDEITRDLHAMGLHPTVDAL
ncbi:MAG: SAM-dependent methyltransferase, partial [Planctomycetota bacterium]